MNCWEAGKSEKVEMMLHLQGCPDVCRVSSTGSGTNHPRRWGRGSMWDGSPRVEQVSLMDLPSNTASKFGNTLSHALWASQVVLVVKKESACQSRRHKRHRFHPWVGKIPWRRAQWPLQYLCLENPMDRVAWWATVHEVAESDTTEQFSMHAGTCPLWHKPHKSGPEVLWYPGHRTCASLWLLLYSVS